MTSGSFVTWECFKQIPRYPNREEALWLEGDNQYWVWSSRLPILPTFWAQKFDFGQVWNQLIRVPFSPQPCQKILGTNTLEQGILSATQTKSGVGETKTPWPETNETNCCILSNLWGFLPGNPNQVQTTTNWFLSALKGWIQWNYSQEETDRENAGTLGWYPSFLSPCKPRCI